MKNWFEIAVGVYLLAMILYGHHRGFIRLVVSLTAIVLTLIVVNIAMPHVSAFVKERTPVYSWIVENIKNGIPMNHVPASDDAGMLPQDQRAFIEGLNLPQEVEELFLEHSGDDLMETLGIDAFSDYIGDYLANVIVNLLGYVILTLIVYIGLRLLASALNIVSKLPILSGMNQLAGAILGGIEGLFYLWFFDIILAACSGMAWASSLLAQIQASSWLSFLYRYNIISRLAMGIIKGILS